MPEGSTLLYSKILWHRIGHSTGTLNLNATVVATRRKPTHNANGDTTRHGQS